LTLFNVTIMFLCLLLLSLTFNSPGSAGMPTGQNETLCTASACYTLHLGRQTFDKAQGLCHANGGNLITVKNEEEAFHIQALLSRISRDTSKERFGFWIGLQLARKRCYQGHKPLKGFTWISGEETSYSNWEREPSGTCTLRRCVIINYDVDTSSKTNFRWSDENCGRSKDGYLCKFNFKGMCRKITLAGPGTVTYKTPFGAESKTLALVPFGSFAHVSCELDGRSQFIVCFETREDVFDWARSGPFCASLKHGCSYNKGGCDHYCIEGLGGNFHCKCNVGYQLGEDQLSCIPTDYCKPGVCEYECVSRAKGFECKCPMGYKVAPNQKNCIEIDECEEHNPCDQLCINTEGSFTCKCLMGFQLINGVCQYIDKCSNSSCTQGCLNSNDSFICYCYKGYALANDRVICVDVNECENHICEDLCINTLGSFECSCKEGSLLAPNGISCIPDYNHYPSVMTLANEKVQGSTLRAQVVDPTEEQSFITSGNTNTAGTPSTKTEAWSRALLVIATEVSTEDMVKISSDESQNLKNQTNNNSWVLISILGTFAATIFVTFVVALLVCYSRTRKEKRKRKSATDNYCWVLPSDQAQINNY
uniref:CD93 molecule n=1 Tax=Latimeria chalumnae TaxID=7897 RepID=H3BEL6_LATCH